MKRQMYSFDLFHEVTQVALSSDKRLVAASCLESGVNVWGITPSTETKKLFSYRRSTRCIAFTPSGSQIISGSTDGTVRLWELDPTVKRTSEDGDFGGSCVQIIKGHAV